MTTRTDAVHAAYAELVMSPPLAARVIARDSAEAASDVWEPEVEKWKAHTLALSKVIDAMLATGSYTSTYKQIHDEAKEALQ